MDRSEENSANYVPEGEDIYGRTIEKKSGVKAQKYIPPHLRRKAAASDGPKAVTTPSESEKILKRRLNGVLNKVTLLNTIKQLRYISLEHIDVTYTPCFLCCCCCSIYLNTVVVVHSTDPISSDMVR